MNKLNITQSLPFNILIVDDNPQNLQVLAKILQENNYEIEFATNGEAALKWLKDKKFDLILLDINMPGMNGFEVCKKIRSNPELNNVPVIFLSADTDRESILKGFEFRCPGLCDQTIRQQGTPCKSQNSPCS
jgi:CheY-like chemotaxis protein